MSSGPPRTASHRETAGDDSLLTSDMNMGWLLVIAADACLKGDERTMTFVELGCGEPHLAIERVLGAVMSSRTALPVAILDRLTHWLDSYTGSPEEPRLRAMLGEIRAHQAQPVPLRGHQAAQYGAVSARCCRSWAR
ncbi:hypothetical protein EB74_08775 [Mycobacterium sp. SWH-M5]|nr:hypothetical protein EB74_08775 [Mycobacterium sp. SWH-M5]